MAKRVFLIVLDSCGIGAAPDAALFNDAGANTMKSISQSAEFNIENLNRKSYSDNIKTTIDVGSRDQDGNLIDEGYNEDLFIDYVDYDISYQFREKNFKFR